MATTLSTPARQPFGVLNESKLRHLQSVKNRQNAIIPSSLLKRRAASPDDSDTENVDPKSFDLKRKRATLDDDVSFSKPKPARYSLSTIPAPQGPRVLPATPRIDTVNKSTTPATAPAAAGRSPTRKRQSLSQSRRRWAPPALGTRSPSLSITAALNGTLAHKKSRKVRTLEDSKPKSWFFDIYEEPEAVQHDRMNDWTISQSATNLLDISDDEGKLGKSLDDRGKENIDPNEVYAPLTRSMAAAKAASDELKKDVMADDRVPLGEMDPSHYYPAGLDATSVVLVQDDVSDAQPAEQQSAEEPAPADATSFTFEAEKPLPVDIDSENIRAVIMSSVPNWEAQPLVEAEQAAEPNEIPRLEPDEELEIWESESAKDENEKHGDESIFALSEL
ncbi:uncharacterized protein HMPREF1541_10381 [Cyphellophora europaea CBS 101466]|uniref:Uncharacterized protein n=1 Tax=Cyphellophora europaea (strain CBS 101466) TaxID=1220924 RepID=W2S7M4_CYPE1|nr:uncharacterized protein HMPREF1541_10381 [Cyphellophora europaea CBS 101466]ETN44711.1 hypothetical protein HMPREF1541_10381 [Cyphellophora europaea CBS 101466]